jgi:hypothetical protein
MNEPREDLMVQKQHGEKPSRTWRFHRARTPGAESKAKHNNKYVCVYNIHIKIPQHNLTNFPSDNDTSKLFCGIFDKLRVD